MTFATALRDALEELGVPASNEQFRLMQGHFEILTRWNRRMNLTAVRDGAEAAKRHFGESAFLHRELPDAETIVDIGSGAGFPGVPLAVLRPRCSVVLVESKRRKAAFLRAVARDIPNVSVAECRIEDWRGTADWAVMRAVNPATALPCVANRVPRAAILGTDRPLNDTYGPWERKRTPWSDHKFLWIGIDRQHNSTNVSRETLAGRDPC